MTTIAFDGCLLAADRRSSYFNCALESTKIVDCGAYWLARLGAVEDSMLTEEWLRSGAGEEGREVAEDGVHGVVVEKASGLVLLAQGKRLVLWRPESPYFAVGSGSDFATMAMHLGKSAPEAVHLASLFDPGTGSGVDVLYANGELARWRPK